MRENLNLIWAELILEELRRLGVALFHIAPGRRNAPFCIVAERLGLDVVSHFDERSLAFHALGAAKQGPAALICTSGSALANCMPAVVEAYESSLPLIVITADRPAERHGIGDWQAIDQVKFFGSFIKKELALPTPTEEVSAPFILSQMAQLVQEGPTHLNCPLREPLMEEKQPLCAHYLCSIEKWLQGKEAWSVGSAVKTANGIVVAGSGGAEALEVARSYGWPLFPCITSTLRMVDDPHIIHHFEWLLDDLECEVVIHIGGKVVSKKLEQFLQKKRPKLITKSTFNPASLQRIENVEALASPELAKLQEKSSALEASVREEPVREILSHLQGRGLFLGSSLTVRLAHNFAPANGGRVDILCNRGASGIDGAISSACGFARGLKRGVVALMGELTFLYDLNALALLKASPYPITLVVLNNGGGGLFSALPMPSSEGARRLMETPQQVNLQKAAEAFSIPYATDAAAGLNMKRSSIIEISIDKESQVNLLKEPFHAVSGNNLH